MSSSLQQLASNLVHKGKLTLEEYNQTYEGNPLPLDKTAVNSEPTDKIVITDPTFNSFFNKGTTMNTTTQTFAAIKAKRDAIAREKKAKAVAFAQHFAAAAEHDDLIQIIGVACNIPDQSKLGKTLMFNMQRAAGNQLIQYLKAEPDELPAMSIGEIRGIESECRIDLLENTLSFLGKELNKLKPRRAMIKAGSVEAALFILTAEAVAMIETHPKDGYKKLDADLAKALNTILDCGLPIGEETLHVYEWDNEPFENNGVDATHDQKEVEQDESYSWG